MNIGNLSWLMNWFYSNYNEKWMEDKGIRISTFDNPGWSLDVNIDGTKLEGKPFISLKIENSNDDWIHCTVENKIFLGVGGQINLWKIFQIFRKWANNSKNIELDIEDSDDQDFIWLINWFNKKCDGDWEQFNSINICTIDDPLCISKRHNYEELKPDFDFDRPAWYVIISLFDTELAKKEFYPIKVIRSNNDWVFCHVYQQEYIAFGGPFNVPEMLRIFRNWAEDK